MDAIQTAPFGCAAIANSGALLPAAAPPVYRLSTFMNPITDSCYESGRLFGRFSDCANGTLSHMMALILVSIHMLLYIFSTQKNRS
jgi:hypothetical protein